MFTCLKESLYWGAWKDGRVGSWASFLLWKQQGCNSENHPEGYENSFNAKDIMKKTFEEGKGRSRNAFGNQTPGMATCKWERYHRHGGPPWETKESSYIRHPLLTSPGVPHNIWGLKIIRAYLRELWKSALRKSQRAVGSWDSALKGPVLYITNSETQHRHRSLKSTWVIHKVDLLTNLGMCQSDRDL